MKIKQVINHGETAWMLDAGLIEGKRRRFFFSSESAAKSKRSELAEKNETIGKYWTELDGHARQDALEVLREIHKAGLTLRTVWAEYKRKPNPIVSSIRTGEAIKQCIASKEKNGRRSHYVVGLEGMLKQFATGHETAPLNEAASVANIEAYMNRYDNGWSRSTALNRVSTLCAFAVKRGWLTANPCDRIERPKLDRKPPKILSIRQAAFCLAWTRRKAPRLLAWLTLAMFQGVRPHELDRLTWSVVDLNRGTVTIDEEVSKVRRRRIVELEPVALAWLKEAKENGAELSIPHISRRRWVRQLRGKLHFERWPTDLFRHTAASYLLEHHRNAGKVALALGDSETILFRHYRELVQADAAKKFWALMPKPMTKKPEKKKPKKKAKKSGKAGKLPAATSAPLAVLPAKLPN